MPDIYSQKQNAVRAARKAIADGSSPAPTYEIKTAKGGGFRIVWDAEPTAAPADARERFIEQGIAELEAADAATGGQVEREEEVDNNEPGDQSPEDEQSAEALATWVEPTPTASKRAKGNTQLAKVTDLLQRPDGATIAEIQAATGWLPHTTRAFISVQVKRKAGLNVVTEKVEGRGRVYRVAA